MRNPCAALLFLAIPVLPLAAAISQPVKVDGGLVTGVPGRDPAILAFKGVPFAAPPTGDLRWRAPRPVVAWKGVRQADRFSASCMQNIVTEHKPWTYEFMAHNDVSEDCLYLNVWTPAKTSGEKRPVFLYIYGGGFNEGSAAVPVYDGEGLASKGLVVVTINYRVGVLGFLAHAGLSRENEHHASGNYGLLDQVAALQWVQRNIARFGGDPARVAVAGQSAGGMSVHALIASPLGKGLFSRAIVESGGSSVGGGGISVGFRKLDAAEADGQRFMQAKRAASIAELRALSWQNLTAPVTGAEPFRFSPIVDGYLLPAGIAETVAQGRQNDVATLTGVNLGELGRLTPQTPLTAKSFEERARQRYGALADEFLRLYPAAGDEQARASQTQSSRDQALVSMYLWAQRRGVTSHTPAYTYLWDHTLPGPDAARFGAFHTSEVPYVLNTLFASERPFAEADRRIANLMSSYWANFATAGDPNGKGLPSWAPAGGKPEVMELGDTTAPEPVAGSTEKLRFFEKALAK